MKDAIRARWPEVRALFEAALEQPRAARDGWLAAQPVDAALREAAAALLADADDETLGGIDAPGAGDLADGQHIGRYRILRTLGRGGMGVVYLAEQSNPRRRVALKLLAGAIGDGALARFRREAELLARLSHPGIARIVEVDADAGGRPFLVMEYIDGRDLAAHCADLSRDARLSLLARVADAVEHAHARGVVHRDLKPSNILVDAEGQPHVLDFGIGQMIDEGHTLTETGVLLGTPAYMSPEQASGRGKVDARSDVYALGVIAYELVADRLPLPVAGLTPLEALRVVGESTPPPLSRIDRTLRGDLEIVIETALAKEPARRYASAGAFADDLRRYLAREPIRARRPGALHRAMLYARRRPAQVAAVAIAAIGLAAGAALALNAALAERRERDRAEAALAQAQDTLQALTRVFAAGNPALAGQPEVGFREVLSAAPSQLDGLPALARQRVTYTVALAQLQIGEMAAAAKGFAEAAALAESAGDEARWAQAKLRELMALRSDLSFGEQVARVDALLADPRVARTPLAQAGIALRGAEIAIYTGRDGTSAELRRRAEAAWAEAVAVPPPADDPTLAADIEIDLLVSRYLPALQGEAGAPAIDAYVASVAEARDRLGARFSADLPRLATLAVLSDALPDAVAGRRDWVDRLEKDLAAQLPRLGPTHPAVLARIEMAHGVVPVNQLYDQRIKDWTIAAARAMPVGSRQRYLYLLFGLESVGSQGSGALVVSASEFLAAHAAACSGRNVVDIECVLGLFTAVSLHLAEGDVAQARERYAVLSSHIDVLPPTTVSFALAGIAFALQSLGDREGAASAAERAIEAALASDEINPVQKDIFVMRVAWTLRPDGCARVLELVEPRAARLATYAEVGGDVLVRLLSTCEVRAGRDPAVALARLDAWWQRAKDPSADATVRYEIINAHLEVYDVLGRDAEFARWAAELDAVERRGEGINSVSVSRMGWVRRAREMHGRDPDTGAVR